LKPAKYAVAVRDGSNLFLFRTIKRKATTDVYIFWPIKKFLLFNNPHASYHASGQVHIKTSPKCKPLPPKQQQKPDASLKGIEGILLTPIHAGELKKNCIRSQYDEVFEVPISDISPPQHIGAYQAYFALAERGVSVPVPNMPDSQG
jgi:hypothetical protein